VEDDELRGRTMRRRRAASVMVPITILKSAVSDGAGMYAAAACCSSDLGSWWDMEIYGL
jgi:hypothetical protein